MISMLKTIKLNLVLLTSFFFSQICFGQYTEVINSNRPGISQSAFSVGKKVLQFEIGPYITNENRSLYPSYDANGYGVDFAVHYGIFKEELELNIQGAFQSDEKIYNLTIPVETARANFKQLSIGAKYLIYDPKKNHEEKINLYSYHANIGFKWKDLIPAVAVSAGFNYDSKNNPYLSSGVEGVSYTASIITQSNFYGGWVFITNFLMDRLTSDQEDFHYIITLTHSFNPKWVVFAEKHGIKSDFYADNLIRFGGGYLLNKDLQLDSSLTLNVKDTPSVFNMNFGVSYRIDRHEDILKINNKSSKSERKRRSRNRKKSKRKKIKNFDEG